ncbi:MAG: metallophosphoesterase family protein [Halobacteriovoraceae bacterium]|jgi:acid phosphatase type 7|nr:metallophosphoesterase family protein [Halobacteriovoraceae bacterium]MBT5094246.1 metallophosphoesterase family protein [Halobacteriovoraceae bacterium]
MTKKNVLINIFVFVAFLISGAVNASRGIEHVRVVWHEDPAHEAYVMWTSDKLRLKSYLYFDTVSRSGDLSKYKNKQRAKVRIIRTTLDWVHKVKLTGLTPDTNYFFVAKTKDGSSREFHFRTAPANGKSFKLLLGGDSRSDRPMRQNINRHLSKLHDENSDIIALVHGGDYVANGFSWKQWKAWFEDHLLTTTPSGRLLPIIPARGNHEFASLIFNDVFARPGGILKHNYFTTKINNFRLITLNTNQPHGGFQKLWLKKQLKKAKKEGRWIVANYHRPAYPGYKKPGRALKHWVPLFEKYQIDLAFESDGHVLKRTVPIYKGKRDDLKGITYVGEGGLGVSLRTPKKAGEWYLQAPGYADKKYHVMMLDVGQKNMSFSVQLMDGTVFDQFDLKPKNRK